MALNPQVGANGVPIVAGDETFLLRRDGLTFEAKEKTLGKFPGKGSLYLTTRSLFFVAAKPKLVSGLEFSSFRIPLQGLVKEKFHQPIFGANYLSGLCPPVVGGDRGIGDIKWRFTFKEGGVGKFLPLYYMVLARMREDGRGWGRGSALPGPYPTDDVPLPIHRCA